MTNRYSWERVFVFWGIAIPSLLSCTRVTDLRPEGRGEVVVVCVLTEEATQSLTLDLTDIASPEDRAALSEAVITLFDETAGQEVGSFQKDGGNDWQLEYAAIPEHAYQLIIKIPGRDAVSASTTMPQRSAIKYRTNMYPKDLDVGVQYDIHSLPSGVVWVMGLRYNRTTGKHVAADIIATSLETVSPQNITDGFFRFADFCASDVYELEYRSAREVVYMFYHYVEGHPLYDKMLRIPPVAENNRCSQDEPFGYFQVAGSLFRSLSEIEELYPMYRLQCRKEDSYILFMSPSEEYDYFLQDIIAKKMQQESLDDYAFLFSRKNVYTNIENGLGIFGGKTEQILPWNDYLVISGGQHVTW